MGGFHCVCRQPGCDSCHYTIAVYQGVRPDPEIDSLSYKAADPVPEEFDSLESGGSHAASEPKIVTALEAQGGKLQECHSSELPVTFSTPNISPKSTPNTSPKSGHFNKDEVRDIVLEFKSEATSGQGIPCKVYQHESGSIKRKTCTMFLDMGLAAIRLLVDNSKHSQQVLELPLFSTHVLDGAQMESQHNAMVKVLQHEDALELSVFLVSPEETHCIVLDDARMMNKSKYGLRFLTKYFRTQAAKEEAARRGQEQTPKSTPSTVHRGIQEEVNRLDAEILNM